MSDLNFKNIRSYSLETDITSKKRLYKSLDNALQNYSNTEGIFVTNSRAFKVAQYLNDRKRQDILLIGYDLVEENLNFLENGTINFLIGQKPEEQGYKSVMAMFNTLIAGKNIERINYSPIDIIMKENIDYYRNYKF
jgi:LacI family transcriptional regulator